jgi:kinetochore protein Mis12/MTW1
LTRAVRQSAVQRHRTEHRLAQFSILSALEPLKTTCGSFMRLYEIMSTLPPPDPELSQVLLLQASGKRQWEPSRTGYLNWAVMQLLEKTKAARGAADDKTGTIDDPDTLKAALEATERSG